MYSELCSTSKLYRIQWTFIKECSDYVVRIIVPWVYKNYLKIQKLYGKYMKKRNSTPAHIFAKRRRRKRGKDTKTNKQTSKTKKNTKNKIKTFVTF